MKTLILINLNNSFDERIYSRNVPKGDFLVNVDPRPLSSDPCADIRFQKERDSLDKYNLYKSPKNMENVQKGNDVFSLKRVLLRDILIILIWIQKCAMSIR